MAKLGEKEIQEAAEQYFQLARKLAEEQWERLPRGRVQVDDLISAASEGLARCLRSYDSSRRKRLRSWIEDHVQWALFDELRRKDLLPQKKRELVKRVQQAREHLEKQLLETPTYAEIAEHLKCSEEEVLEIVQMGNLSEISLEKLEEEGASFASGQEEGERRVELRQQVEALRECFAELTADERVAVGMRFDGATLETIAEVLQLSSPETARRVINRALEKLNQCVRGKGW